MGSLWRSLNKEVNVKSFLLVGGDVDWEMAKLKPHGTPWSNDYSKSGSVVVNTGRSRCFVTYKEVSTSWLKWMFFHTGAVSLIISPFSLQWIMFLRPHLLFHAFVNFSFSLPGRGCHSFLLSFLTRSSSKGLCFCKPPFTFRDNDGHSLFTAWRILPTS